METGTIDTRDRTDWTSGMVSMKSGLGDRNNAHNGKYDQLWCLESQ